MAITDPKLIGLTPQQRQADLIGNLRTRMAWKERGGGSGGGDASSADPNALHRTLADNKGDILVATGANTFAILEGPPMDGSADGWVLTVDSSSLTGLKWGPPTGLPSTIWDVTGHSTLRTYDADSTSLNELFNVFGTLVMSDLVGAPPLGGSYAGITNDTTDTTFDPNSTSIDEIADVLATAIADLDAGTGAGTYTVSTYAELRTLSSAGLTLGDLADALATLLNDEGLA